MSPGARADGYTQAKRSISGTHQRHRERGGWTGRRRVGRGGGGSAAGRQGVSPAAGVGAAVPRRRGRGAAATLRAAPKIGGGRAHEAARHGWQAAAPAAANPPRRGGAPGGNRSRRAGRVLRSAHAVHNQLSSAQAVPALRGLRSRAVAHVTARLHAAAAAGKQPADLGAARRLRRGAADGAAPSRGRGPAAAAPRVLRHHRPAAARGALHQVAAGRGEQRRPRKQRQQLGPRLHATVLALVCER